MILESITYSEMFTSELIGGILVFTKIIGLNVCTFDSISLRFIVRIQYVDYSLSI